MSLSPHNIKYKPQESHCVSYKKKSKTNIFLCSKIVVSYVIYTQQYFSVHFGKITKNNISFAEFQ